VESRSVKLRLFAEPATVETNERVRVRIQPDADTAGWRGALVIEGATPLEREVRGERCEDVVLALALITVLRLDPNRESEAPAAGPPGAAVLAATGASETATTGATATSASSAASAAATSPSETAATPSAASAAAAAAVASTSVGAEPPAAASEPAASALAPAETPPEPAAAPSAADEPAAAEALGSDAVGAGASGSMAAATTAGASETAASEAAAREAEFTRGAGEATAAVSDSGPAELSNGPPLLVAPALAAYAGYASSPSHAFQAVLRGEARFGPGRQAWATAGSLSYGHSGQQNPTVDLGFDSLLAGLAVCPPGLTLSGGLWLEACAEARGGVLVVSVTERELPLEGGSQPRPWFEIGPSLQAGLPLSSRWTLRALSSVSLVLMRDSFDVERVVVDEDGQEQKEVYTLYRPPVASFALLLGIGYEL